MKRLRSSSPAPRSMPGSEVGAQRVGENHSDDTRRPLTPACLGAGRMLAKKVNEDCFDDFAPPRCAGLGPQSVSAFPSPSTAGGLSTSIHNPVVNTPALVKVSGAAAFDPLSESPPKEQASREASVVLSGGTRPGRPTHTQEATEVFATGGAEEWRFFDELEAGQPVAHRKQPAAKAGEALAAEPLRETGGDGVDEVSGKQWLTQQQAVEEFCISAQTLKDAATEGILTVEKRPNPYGSTYAPMRLYRRSELRQLAFRMWGDEIGVEKERERRREQRWQQRQQQVSNAAYESAALAEAGGAGARPRRSLPDLRTFLQSTSKRKRERVQQQSAAGRPPRRELNDKLTAIQRQRRRPAPSRSQLGSDETASTAAHRPTGSTAAGHENRKVTAGNETADPCETVRSAHSPDVEWEEI